MVLGQVTATGLWGPYSGTTDEVQTVTITGGPTGGTFTLTWGGQTTAAIAYNATAATVQALNEAWMVVAALTACAIICVPFARRVAPSE